MERVNSLTDEASVLQYRSLICNDTGLQYTVYKKHFLFLTKFAEKNHNIFESKGCNILRFGVQLQVVIKTTS